MSNNGQPITNKENELVKQLIAHYRRLNKALNSADIELLNRWENNDANAINELSKIVTHAKKAAKVRGDAFHAAEAVAFLIIFVLAVKNHAEKINEISPTLIASQQQKKRLENRFRRTLSKTIASDNIPLQRLPEYLTKVAAKLANLETVPPTELPVRSSIGGSRSRTLFMMELSNMMTDLTGLRLDNEVAALTDLAFPQAEATSTDAVRSATRPSTRKGRSGDPAHKTPIRRR